MPVDMAEPARPSRRDPSARGRLSGLILTLVVLWPMLQTSGFSLKPLFDADNLKVIGGFLAQFLPPETSGEFLAYLGQATLETLAIATAGMALAFVIAVPMAYLSTGAARERSRSTPSPAACSPSCAAFPSWSGLWCSCASSAWARQPVCWPWA
jgi:phosphonate transport system permease protein